MRAVTIGLVSGLLLSLVGAMPFQKRAYVTITVTDEVTSTIDLTVTVTVDGEATPPPSSTVVSSTSTISTISTTSSAQQTTSSTPAPSAPNPGVQAYEVPPTTTSSTTSTSETPVYTPPTSTSTSTPTPTLTPTPTPSSTEEPTSTSSAAATSSSSSSSGGSGSCDSGNPSSGSPCTGQVTYYTPGLGACGVTNTEADLIVALDSTFMGPQSNGNAYCGKTITLSYNGITVSGTVEDKCPGCDAETDLDLSPAFFQKFADLGEGRLSNVDWWFED